MIFPILKGLVHWQKAPMTWLIVALNLIVFILIISIGQRSQFDLEELMRNEYFVQTQGRVYAQYILQKSSAHYPTFLRKLAGQIESGENERVELLGQLAFRDAEFLTTAKSISFDGDQVAFKLWKKNVENVQSLQQIHPSFTLGLSVDDSGIERWVTYIFVHSGFTHLAFNMLFFLIFGAALEAMIGGLGLLVVFLSSGIFAAGVFALMTGVTTSPLVGASGSVSGIMALYCALSWNHPVRYFYWLFLPFRGFMGFVYMPAWIGLALWFVSDLAGYLGTMPELGGVAHTAHLGGELAGVIVALVLFAFRRLWPRSVPMPERPIVPQWKLIPFLPPQTSAEWFVDLNRYTSGKS